MLSRDPGSLWHVDKICERNIEEANKVFWPNTRACWYFWDQWMKHGGGSMLLTPDKEVPLPFTEAALKMEWGPWEYFTHLFSWKTLGRWMSLQLWTKGEKESLQRQSVGLPDQAKGPAWTVSLCSQMSLEQTGRGGHWQEGAGLGPERPVPPEYQPEEVLPPGTVVGRSCSGTPLWLSKWPLLTFKV